MNAFGNWQQHDVDAFNAKVAAGKLGAGAGAGGAVAASSPSPRLCGPGPDLEANLHDSILEYCRARGWLAIHSRMDKPTTTALGVSDFVIVTPNTVLFVEAKRKGNKPTPKQRGFLMAVGALGWPNTVVYSMADFESWIKERE